MGSVDLCVPATFPGLSLYGTEFLSLEASVITNYSFNVPGEWRYSQPSIDVQNATFCNITVSYTHPGYNDTVYVETWLPFKESWNSRLQALGGGGWVAGRFVLTYAGMAGAVADGYATVTTDGGVGSASTPDSWALMSPGNLNLGLLEDFGSRALNEESIIAKSLIESFYGRNATYSYWNGCSQGGRQGAMLAQRYPEAYDGIVAAAPAVNWVEFYVSNMWPPVYMYLTNQYPMGCELTQLTSLAITQCDGMDGIVDGIIVDTEACRLVFDPFAHVGSSFYCAQSNSTRTISQAAAAVANATWHGPSYSSGDFMWYGFEIGADLTVLAPTTCFNNGTCTGGPNSGLSSILEILRDFVMKDLSLNITSFTHQDFDAVYRNYKHNVGSLLETADADLRPFRDAGGKMVTYHGLSDDTIPTRNSLEFYQEVTNIIPGVQDFYRYYLVPGLGHCWGGSSGQPDTLFNQLRAWVENLTVPEQVPVIITMPNNTTQPRVLCPYPDKPIMDKRCINGTVTSNCWSCSS